MNGEGSLPNSGTLKLFSKNEDSYFEYNNLVSLLGSNGDWTNTTLSVGSNQHWILNNSPDWENITGFELRLEWSLPTNLTIKIDSLFFRKYVPFLEVAGIAGVIQLALINLGLPFIIDWILWSGILIIVGKLFQEELGPWKNLFNIIGYTLIVTFVYTVINSLAISSLPVINLPLDNTLATVVINDVWAPLLGYQVSIYLPLVERIWLSGLSAIIIHLMKNINWNKTLTIVAISF
jgi:hypothetical protein